MNIIYPLHLPQHVSTDLDGHHQVVVQIHKKKSILGSCLPLIDTKCDILVSWLLLKMVE